MQTIAASKRAEKQSPPAAALDRDSMASASQTLQGTHASLPIYLQHAGATGAAGRPLPPNVQAKSLVAAAGSTQEQAADQAADSAVGPLWQKVGANAKPTAPVISASEVNRQIDAAAPEARPLPDEQRRYFEVHFDRDFGTVRVHSGTRAAAAAASISAQAFARGSNIYFGADRYLPETHAGRWLLAHELAHTVQQPPTAAAPGAQAIHRKPDESDAAIKAAGDAKAVADGAKLAAKTNEPADPNEPTASTTPTPEAAPNADIHEDSRNVDTGNNSHVSDDKSKDGKDAPGRPPTDQKDNNEADETRGRAEQGGAGDQGTPDQVGTGDQETDQGTPAAQPAPAVISDLLTGDLALIDKELAEHQRWGAASTQVGAAGSHQRAEFIARAGGSGSGFTHGLVQGAAMGAGMKIGEKLIEKGAVKLAASAATKLGTQAAKFTPLPAVGAVIGGVMSAYELAHRDWKETGATIGRFGKGADIYDTLANSLEAISTVIDVATQVLNVIAGIIGVISIAMWVITVLTVGIASPLAATLSTIAAGIGLATMVLDGINALVLKQLITIFRSLHAFTSDADPRDVVAQGGKISQAAGAATGFVGGFAGGLAGGGLVEKGSKMIGGKEPTPAITDHPTPPAAPGEGPTVKAEPKSVTEPTASKPAPDTVSEASASKPAAEPVIEPPAVKPAPEPVTEPTASKPLSDAVTEVPDGKPATEPVIEPSASKPASEPVTEPPASKPVTELEPVVGETKKPMSKGKRLRVLERLKRKSERGDLSSGDITQLAELLDVSVDDVNARFRKAEFETTVQEKTASSEGRGIDPELRNIPEAPIKLTPAELKRIKEVKGEGKISKRVEADIRKTSKRNFESGNKEAVDISKHTPLTQKTRENVAEHGLEYVEPLEGGTPKRYEETRGFDFVEEGDVQKGGMAVGFEESHLVPVKQEPAFAHKDASVGESRREHGEVTHKTDPAAELELLSQRAEPSPGFQSSESALGNTLSDAKERVKAVEKRAAAARKDAARADGRAKSAERRGDIVAADKHRAAAESHRENARGAESEANKLREAIPQLEDSLRSIPAKDRRGLGRVSAKPSQPVPPPGTATPELSPAPTATEVTASDQLTSAAQTSSTAPEVSKSATSQTEVTSDAETTASTAITALALPPAANARTSSLAPVSHLPATAHASIPNGNSGTSTSGDLNADMPELGRMSRGPISGRERLAFYAAWGSAFGATGVRLAALMAPGYEKARSEPIVEHVNPSYPPPPCTPQEVIDIQNEIGEVLDARAKAAMAASAMAQEEAKHQANAESLSQLQAKNQEVSAANEAHKQIVAQRDEANKKKKEQEDQVAGTVAGYSDKAAQLATITVPMRGFERFTSLATSLPDSPDVLKGAKSGILKMNADSKRFLSQLDSVDQTMTQQQAAQGERSQQVQADANTIEETDSQAKRSGDTFDQTQQTVQQLDANNQTRLAEAGILRTNAADQAAVLDVQAEAKRVDADSKAQALQAWAKSHRDARMDALAQTKKRLEAQGYQATEVKEQ